jgi:2'-5' RNA ligase
MFAAVELPEAVRDRLGRRVAAACSRFPAASWVKPGNLHATLAFVGEAEASEAATASEALARACARRPPIAAATAGVGVFPERGPVRVIWIALEPAGALEELAGAVRDELSGAGVRFDERPFQAHVTLARARSPWPATWRERLAPLAGEAAGFEVREAVLLASELAPGGSIYRRVAACPLEGRRG